MPTRNTDQFEPVIEPGGGLRLHLTADQAHTLCNLPMTATGWRPWGISYPRDELASAASGLICRLCIGRLPVPLTYDPGDN